MFPNKPVRQLLCAACQEPLDESKSHLGRKSHITGLVFARYHALGCELHQAEEEAEGFMSSLLETLESVVQLRSKMSRESRGFGQEEPMHFGLNAVSLWLESRVRRYHPKGENLSPAIVWGDYSGPLYELDGMAVSPREPAREPEVEEEM